jgi:arylsulfatase A-like enzyme
MSRRAIVTGILATFVMLTAAPSPAAEQPNILFLVADEYRHDCLSVAGHPLVRTPHLDRLARQGVRFTNAYAASPVCSPSRATLFTGRYPQVHGVVRNGQALNAGEIALPALLKHHGYTTAMMGKLHLPPDRWFDPALITAGGRGTEYRQFLAARLPRFRGISNTAATPETLIGPPRTPLRIGTSVLPEALYEEAWIADRAIEFLEGQKGKERPWFLYVSMLKPHSEFVIPEPYATMYRPADMPLPSTFHADAPTAEIKGLDANPRLKISDTEVLRAVIAHYYGSVALVDTHMGRILDAVERLGMDGKTLVVFTADHGNMLGERNRMFKGVMYESSARVPLLLKAPGRLPAGKVVDTVLDNTSVMPTLLELADLPVPSGNQGRSLVAEARGNASSAPQRAFSVLRHRMVREGNFKLIDPYQVEGASPELYNVVDDPDEQKNLFDRPEVSRQQASLKAALGAWWAQKPPAGKMP